jgi:CubicO group peptidase (beta-lactamase class C family)
MSQPFDRRKLLAIGAAGALSMASGCARRREPDLPPPPTPSGGAAQLYFPPAGSSWETVDPRSVGWRPDALDAALAEARAQASTGVVILHHGRILAERYWGAGNRPASDVASVQKSVTSILIGIAQQAGRLSVDDPVSRRLGPGWSRADAAAESQILIRHLLSMTSGLDDDLRYRYPAGSRWVYNTPAYSTLLPMLEGATGAALADFSRRSLFAPVGMGGAAWEPRGQRSAAPRAGPIGLRLTARDMARFGLLVLAHGSWADGRTVCPGDYVRTALSASQEANPSYGWLWWLNGKAAHQTPQAERAAGGALFPDAPGDLVAALGALGQKVYVVPSLGLVVARQGGLGSPRGEDVAAADDAWWRTLMAAAPR